MTARPILTLLLIALASSVVPAPRNAPVLPAQSGAPSSGAWQVGAGIETRPLQRPGGSGLGRADVSAEARRERDLSRRQLVPKLPSEPASGAPQPAVTAEEPPAGEVGTALYSASATWCAPTPTQCQSWGGNARLAAVNSFRWGDEPYPVRVWRGDAYVDVTVVSFCACRGTLHAIDLSPAAFEVLAPLSVGRIDVEVEVLTDLPPHEADDRMRTEDGGPTLPATDMAP